MLTCRQGATSTAYGLGCFLVAQRCLAIAAWLGRREWAARSRGAAFVSVVKTVDFRVRDDVALAGRHDLDGDRRVLVQR
jgi:hypothetical protein